MGFSPANTVGVPFWGFFSGLFFSLFLFLFFLIVAQ